MRHSAIIALTHDATPDDILWLEQWLGRRGQAQRMLEHLARVTPDEVMLTNFRQEDDSCVLSGQAISATAVRQLERALHQDPLCGQQIQQEVLPQALGQRPIQSFTLRFRPGTTEGR
jgi:Tfp pilus assembly protein PilN